jgi:hypothetical protein
MLQEILDYVDRKEVRITKGGPGPRLAEVAFPENRTASGREPGAVSIAGKDGLTSTA